MTNSRALGVRRPTVKLLKTNETNCGGRISVLFEHMNHKENLKNMKPSIDTSTPKSAVLQIVKGGKRGVGLEVGSWNKHKYSNTTLRRPPPHLEEACEVSECWRRKNETSRYVDNTEPYSFKLIHKLSRWNHLRAQPSRKLPDAYAGDILLARKRKERKEAMKMVNPKAKLRPLSAPTKSLPARPSPVMYAPKFKAERNFRKTEVGELDYRPAEPGYPTTLKWIRDEPWKALTKKKVKGRVERQLMGNIPNPIFHEKAPQSELKMEVEMAAVAAFEDKMLFNSMCSNLVSQAKEQREKLLKEYKEVGTKTSNIAWMDYNKARSWLTDCKDSRTLRRRAAVKIQAFVRGCWARERIWELYRRILKVQAFFRGCLSRFRVARLRIMIQVVSRWRSIELSRGMMRWKEMANSRRHLSSYLLWVLHSWATKDMRLAIHKWHKYCVESLSSVLTMQRYARGWLARQEAMRELRNIRRIQAIFRGSKSREKLLHLRQTRASLMIQAHYRGWQGRLEASMMRKIRMAVQWARRWKISQGFRKWIAVGPIIKPVTAKYHMAAQHYKKTLKKKILFHWSDEYMAEVMIVKNENAVKIQALARGFIERQNHDIRLVLPAVKHWQRGELINSYIMWMEFVERRKNKKRNKKEQDEWNKIVMDSL